jgi:hypothetical protein
MLRRSVTEERQRSQEPGEKETREREWFSNAQKHSAMMPGGRPAPKWFRGLEWGGTWSYNHALNLIVLERVRGVVRSLARKVHSKPRR